MTRHRVGIIMNGVTGRMGTHQHLIRSICAISDQGGICVPSGAAIWPEPVLVGRNKTKLQQLAAQCGIEHWTTDLDSVLRGDDYPIYFDAQITNRRVDAVRQALQAGKHVYCEKPIAETAQEAVELVCLAKEKGLKNGVVQDKLWLPGMQKLKGAIEAGFLGQVFSVRGDFGYWVFDGQRTPAQRPSWNYRKEDGGGIIVDMMCHFSYLLEELIGKVEAISCLGATHLPDRWDEQSQKYLCTADDAAYATLQLQPGIVAHLRMSWCTRVRRDDLLTIQVDGTAGSAVAGLRQCWVQHDCMTTKPVWNPDIDNPIDFYDSWMELPDQKPFDNAFKEQWQLFLRHVVLDEPFAWTLSAGAKNILLAEKAIESWSKRCWVDVPDSPGN